MKRKFERVVVGGTFDTLHKGHKAVLMKAFEVGNYVLIGLSTDEFAEKLRKPHDVATYKERRRELESFLRDRGVLGRAEILPLRDPYGIAVSSNTLDAIVVSRETGPSAKEINMKREDKGLPPLNILTVETVLAENGSPISTTRIRREEIDRNGHYLESR